MATISDIKIALAELSKHIPLAEKLEVSDAWLIPENYSDNPKSYPNSEFPGVYIFSDADEVIIYIGKASCGLGARIGGEYLGREKVRKSEKISSAIYLNTIKLSKDVGFLAPAIEEYLIDKLDPSGNIIGRSRKIF